MTQYLSNTEFQALNQRLESGAAELSISRQVAGQFFSRVSNEAVFSITEQSIALKKAFLFSLFAVSMGIFVACLGLIFFNFGWGATIVIPVVGIFWTILTILTSDKGNQWVGHLGVLVSLVPLSFLDLTYSFPIALFGISIWLHRCLYFLSQYWLVKLVTGSYDAFDMMAEHIDISDPKPLRD